MTWIKLAKESTVNKIEKDFSYGLCNYNKQRAESYINSTFTRANDQITCSELIHVENYDILVREYEEFCQREVMISLGQAFHFCGGLIGGFISNYLLKIISPRRIMLIGLWGQIFCGFMAGFSPSFGLNLFFRSGINTSTAMMLIGMIIG